MADMLHFNTINTTLEYDEKEDRDTLKRMLYPHELSPSYIRTI